MKARKMESYQPTTSFGRRPATLGQIAAQQRTSRVLAQAARDGSNHPAAVNKWHLFRTLTEVRGRLGVSDRALSVLNALLSFHPETALTLPKPPQPTGASGESIAADQSPQSGHASCELIVFPSNKALSLRAHGMAPATLWRHLTSLVEAGLIARRDSPNGKRYARKAADEAAERFSSAFGFDLTPLVARAAEFETLAEDLRREARARQFLKERISLQRRDCNKLIALGLDESLPGDWSGFGRRALGLMTPLRRLKSDVDLGHLAAALDALRADIDNALEFPINSHNLQCNAFRTDEHQSNSKTEKPSEPEPSSKEEGGRSDTPTLEVKHAEDAAGQSDLPLGLVIEACPDISDYAEGQSIRTWPQFIAAADTIRALLGISRDAWTDAVDAMGKAQAAACVGAILQRSEHSSEAAPRTDADGRRSIEVNGSPAIKSPGGYLRSLSAKARQGDFSLGQVLMALIGQRLKARTAGRDR